MPDPASARTTGATAFGVDAVESRWRVELGERRFQAIAEAIARLVALEDD